MAIENFDDNDDLSLLDRGDTIEDLDEDLEDEIEEESETDEVEEDEESDDDEIEEEVEEAPIKPSKNIKVSKARLDEVIAQREEERARSAWLEEQLAALIANQTKSQVVQEKVKTPEVVYDFDTAEENYISLVINGEIDKAKKLRSEIDSNRKQELLNLVKNVQEEATTKATQVSTQAIEGERFKSLVTTLESKYTFLDYNSDDYNEEAVDTINTLLAGYVASGKTKSEALGLAVKKVVPLYVKEVTPPKKSLGDTRTKQSAEKAVKAAKAQPPKTVSTKNTTVDLSKLDISKMSEREYDKLTEKEKRILRGD